MDLESEQKSLVSEQARQNRIAATVSNEMFAECQVRAGWRTQCKHFQCFLDYNMYSSLKDLKEKTLPLE